MVAIIRLGLILLTSALTAQACTYCQCKFQDNSHCCVYSDPEIGNLDCKAICAGAHRFDGVSNRDGTAGTACNAGGKYQCISFITAQGRTPCYKQ
ncbi:hypothetical protein DHEL01_v212984 [Diaporthe helianthi]|uniref:Uncharacterized protein n=1 Tax=Diaporthe helianthi TaxID=158607 RepID=A0A2P5HEF4_DIAHE|nr:hypothetical protein DHEL01_v212984 [Diaporthe helianthi]